MVDANTVVLGASLVALGAAAWHARELRALAEDVEAGYHRELRRLVAAEGDLMEVSHELVSLRQLAARKASVRQTESLFSEAVERVAHKPREREKVRATIKR